MLINLLLLLPIKPQLQIRTRAENLAGASEHDAFHAVVCVEERVRVLELEHHGVGEGIVVLRAVEREDDDGRVLFVVLRLDLREGEVVVGFWEGERGAGEAGHDA